MTISGRGHSASAGDDATDRGCCFRPRCRRGEPLPYTSRHRQCAVEHLGFCLLVVVVHSWNAPMPKRICMSRLFSRAVKKVDEWAGAPISETGAFSGFPRWRRPGASSSRSLSLRFRSIGALPTVASSRAFRIVDIVSVEEIKNSSASLSAAEQTEVSAFLFHFRHASDPEYQERVKSRLSDTEPSHWLAPEEFERQLDGK
jgi:hypothetical protein